jgi:ketosteroid isomerase-like protein
MKFISLCLLFFTTSCSFFSTEKEEINTNEEALIEMQKADIAFSEYSKLKGMHKAFLQFIADDAVLLHSNTIPIIGADAILFIANMNDANLELTWNPLGGEVASSGELGYTYGTFFLKKDTTTMQQGSYVTIWKKQPDGKWKFVLEKHD